MSASPRIAVVGTGAVARAVVLAYAAAGGTVAAVVSRQTRRAARLARAAPGARGSCDLADALEAGVVIVAIPDRALAGLADRLAATPGPRRATLLHTSGAMSGDVLAPSGLRTGSLHPLQSFPAGAADDQLRARVPGTHWFHEGDGWAPARAIVKRLGGTIHRLAPGGKALYHAGASVLSNHTVGLFDAALTLLAVAGVPRDESQAPLAALLAGTAANIAELGVPAALTGPIARGDAETVRRHVAALRDSAPELLPSYIECAKRTLVVARAKGSLDATAARDIERLLAVARTKTGPNQRGASSHRAHMTAPRAYESLGGSRASRSPPRLSRATIRGTNRCHTTASAAPAATSTT